MMADERNKRLQALFTENTHDLGGDEFVSGVMKQTHKLKYRMLMGVAGVALVLLMCLWLFAAPVQAFSLLVTKVLSIALIDLGEGWLAWMLAPVNNIASLIILGLKALRMAWKRMVRVSYGI